MSEEKNLLKQVSTNPHIRSIVTTQNIMFCVLIALLPTTIYGTLHFGLHAFLLVLTCVLTAVITEFLYGFLFTKAFFIVNEDGKYVRKFRLSDIKKSTITDGSAMVTGLLLALNLPPAFPIWMAIVGSIFAILVVKMLFGGLGQNFMNPALGGRCFLLLSFAGNMTNFTIDGVSSATPLALLKNGEAVNVRNMITGNIAGTIGETSMIAILIGACFLILLGVIDLRIPGTYIVTFAIFILIFGKRGFDLQYLSAQLAGGGLMLGAFFMATDYVTRPVTKKGQYLFGIFLGIMTGVFRIFGKSAEGVSYAIIIGNLLVPLIERITEPKAFGKGGERV